MSSGGLIGLLFLLVSLLAAVFEWMRRGGRLRLADPGADRSPDPERGVRQNRTSVVPRGGRASCR